MDDLIARANKYAKSAGRTGEGQYRAARENETCALLLSATNTILSAVVGTSIFAQWVQTYPLPFGVAAIVAAALSAVQRTSKLDERAEAHRMAGAEYGRLRRRADMLRLQLEGGDVNRAEGVATLKQIGEDLSELAKRTRALPDRIYKPARDSFDKEHPEYFTTTSASVPTHAGGVVIRRKDATVQYLIVQAKKEPHEWVLPKGHIKRGETAEQAARREVLEETGVEAAVWDVLDTVEFSAPNELVRAQFFLMEAVREGSPHESREQKWLTFDEALNMLKFKEAQQLVCQTYILLRKLSDNGIKVK